jgi:hypothetical protein
MNPDTMTTLRISSPSDLITAVPYLIGFTPAESVVLVGLTGTRVAVTIRIDVSDGEAGLIKAMGLAFEKVEQVLLIAYTEQPLPQWLAMPPACGDALLVTGGRWRSLLCTNPVCCPAEGTPLTGDVPAVAAAAVAAGLVAMASRDEVTAALQPGTPTPQASQQAEALTAIAARDRAWLAIDASFAAGQDLHPIAAHYLDIARHCAQDPRAAASWFLYAWTAWRIGDGVRAVTALGHVFALDPGYSAARLLQAALQGGINPATTPALTDMEGELS